MYGSIYEEAIAKIESKRQYDVEIAKQRATQDQIIPFNHDIDCSLRDAVLELQNKHNDKIAKLQKDFEDEKRILTDAAAKKKADFADLTIHSAVSAINSKADGAIADLRKLISKEGA